MSQENGEAGRKVFMRQRVRKAVLVLTLVGVASIVYGVAIVVRFLESTRLDATGERVAGVILIIGGLACVGLGMWTALSAAIDQPTDALMQRRFGLLEPVDDPSGLLGQPSGTPPAKVSEDEPFDAYMRRYFPVIK